MTHWVKIGGHTQIAGTRVKLAKYKVEKMS